MENILAWLSSKDEIRQNVTIGGYFDFGSNINRLGNKITKLRDAVLLNPYPQTLLLWNMPCDSCDSYGVMRIDEITVEAGRLLGPKLGIGADEFEKTMTQTDAANNCILYLRTRVNSVVGQSSWPLGGVDYDFPVLVVTTPKGEHIKTIYDQMIVPECLEMYPEFYATIIEAIDLINRIKAPPASGLRHYPSRSNDLHLPQNQFKILTIGKEHELVPTDHQLHRGGWQQREHWVRQHLRQYKSGKTAIISSHLRGSKELGIVDKVYEVNPEKKVA